MDGEPSCPSCGSTGLESFHRQDRIPSHSCLLLADAAEARAYPQGSMRLAMCPACGFISNLAFDPSLSAYSSDYEETQGYSPQFQDFARSLARRWVERYQIRDKDVLEIGCGKGEFLALLCEAGGNRGVGIDPSAAPERLSTEAMGRLRFLKEYYGEHHFDIPADVIVCRHTLEHIAPTAEFMELVRRSIGNRDTVVLFELPDVLRVLREVAFWDLYYEHCSYFTSASLARLFRRTGFEVIDLSLEFDGQYIVLEARPTRGRGTARLPVEESLDELREAVDGFRGGLRKKQEEWREELLRLKDDGKRAVIWGAGSKGVAFLTTLGIQDEVEFAVDINPHKHGMYMAGTGQRIVAPDFLVSYRPDLVILMNPVYRREVQRTLDQLDVSTRLATV